MGTTLVLYCTRKRLKVSHYNYLVYLLNVYSLNSNKRQSIIWHYMQNALLIISLQYQMIVTMFSYQLIWTTQQRYTLFSYFSNKPIHCYLYPACWGKQAMDYLLYFDYQATTPYLPCTSIYFNAKSKSRIPDS